MSLEELARLILDNRRALEWLQQQGRRFGASSLMAVFRQPSRRQSAVPQPKSDGSVDAGIQDEAEPSTSSSTTEPFGDHGATAPLPSRHKLATKHTLSEETWPAMAAETLHTTGDCSAHASPSPTSVPHPNWTSWRVVDPSLASLPSLYLQLSKPRLSALVATTALGGFLLAPAAAFSPVALVGCVLGTSAMSTAANTFNQFMEAPYDAQMRRTQARVLVRGRLTPVHAVVFGAAAAGGGFALLWAACNPLTATLGACNVLVYAGIYTPLKRSSVACTWAGAVVGAIPPLMGWAAATGGVFDAGALTLAAVLFAWQFPHFNALSWNLRQDYSKAGYRVMCVVNPALCRRTTLRYSVVLLGLCSVAAPLTDLTSWTFAVDTIPLNAYFIYLSYKFYASADSANSRRLFRFSLFYLPAVMLLMIVSSTARGTHKKAVAERESGPETAEL